MKSVLTKYNGFCIFCGKPTQTEHHLLFGIGIRELAEEDGVKIPVCDAEHNMAGGTRQMCLKRYGRTLTVVSLLKTGYIGSSHLKIIYP